MIINFLIICKRCSVKHRREENVWDKIAMCSLHNNGDGTMIFSCGNCDFQEVFRPDQMHQYTPRELLLEQEKRKIEMELIEEKPKN